MEDKRQKKRDTDADQGTRWGIAAAVAFFVVVLAFFLAWPTSEKSLEPNVNAPLKGKLELLEREIAGPTESAKPRDNLVDDDGQTLWESPTAGAPIPLDYLPQGTQFLFHCRPSELLAHSEGEKILAALGPWGEHLIVRQEQLTGATLEEIETLTVALHPTMSGALSVTLKLRLREVWSAKRLAERHPESRHRYNKQFGYQVMGNRACFLPRVGSGKILVSCPAADVNELIIHGHEPALFPRDMQRLLSRTDVQRMATLVFPTKFWRTGGSKLIAGPAEPLRDVLAQLAQDTATAMAWSAHWDKNFFLELQSTVTLDQRPHRFGKNFMQRMSPAVGLLETAVQANSGPRYGRAIVERFPAMLRCVSETTRSSEVDGVSLLRCTLPVEAGHNLLMGTELALSFLKSGKLVETAESLQPVTLEEKLAQITSLSFPKETLQRALEILAEDLGIAIEIAGRDLQLEGITKNQSFGLALKNRPGREILLAVLQQANPDHTATGPRDIKQKLVYVIRQRSDGPSAIVVTTRTAARRRDEQLPDEFVPREE